MPHSKPSDKVRFLAFDHQQKRLAQHCFWEESEQTLWIDCRKIIPQLGVVRVPSWDALTLSSTPVPDYPKNLNVLAWSNYSDLAYWRKQIPPWVQDSCGLFETHQLKLLHYSGKYPQVLELLDHAPMLAWRLMSSELDEPEIVALLSGKRQHLALQVGWPGSQETVKFLTNLRLRFVNEAIVEQVEVCLLDDKRLTALQDLPRINSMALSLAAQFPELIGSRLHHALAKLPCRPMQCKSMLALLDDAYQLSSALKLPQSECDKIGLCRYLVEVSQLYQAWLKKSAAIFSKQLETEFTDNEANGVLEKECKFRVTIDFKWVQTGKDWLALGQLQQHAWWLEYQGNKEAQHKLVAWRDDQGVWAAWVNMPLDVGPVNFECLKVRGEGNCLPAAQQWSALHLWLANKPPS